MTTLNEPQPPPLEETWTERRKMPHPYELFQHIDGRFLQLREDLCRIVMRQDDHERKLRNIEDALQQAAGMAKMVRIAIIGIGIVWGLFVWAETHFHW